MVATLMVATSAAGLWVHELYHDAPWASAAFRGGDLVTLVVAAPALIVALLLSRRGSRRAQLVWAGILAYSVYNCAFYVFGAVFNDVFLLHVALFSLSLFALALTLANLDVAGIGAGFGRRTPVRCISAFLMVVAAGLGGMWIFSSLRFAATGKLPDGVMPASGVHLVYTLDLALVVAAPGAGGHSAVAANGLGLRLGSGAELLWQSASSISCPRPSSKPMRTLPAPRRSTYSSCPW